MIPYNDLKEFNDLYIKPKTATVDEDFKRLYALYHVELKRECRIHKVDFFCDVLRILYKAETKKRLLKEILL